MKTPKPSRKATKRQPPLGRTTIIKSISWKPELLRKAESEARKAGYLSLSNWLMQRLTNDIFKKANPIR